MLCCPPFRRKTMAHFKELNEEQWVMIQELMNWTPPKVRGKPRTHLKRVWNSIFYILTHGCRWDDLPKDSPYAHKATAHRWLLFWQRVGIFERVVTGLLLRAVAEGKVDWNRLIGDGSFSPCTWRRPGGRPRLQGQGSLTSRIS